MMKIFFIYYFLFICIFNVSNSKVLKILDFELIFELFKISKKFIFQINFNNLKNKNINLKNF